ncbi:hypothetical protein [Sporichthya brevicatena]|uniref:hypothetical protein n=1 Tax=Sporichthya brevicatena TaxID=171442 RepID=UPI0031CECF86
MFTVNTKHHPDGQIWLAGDRLLVNGRARPYIRNARHEAGRAAKLLEAAGGRPVAVTGLIVFVGTDSVSVRDVPSDVWVVSQRKLVPFLAAGPVLLEPAEVARVFALARRSDTWQ